MIDLPFVPHRLSGLTSSSPTAYWSGMIFSMTAKAYEISSQEFKNWVLSRDPLRCELPMREQIIFALQELGFVRIRLSQDEPHPVWSVSANVGQFRADSLRSVKLAIKKMSFPSHKLHVHHILLTSIYPQFAREECNVLILCPDCHNAVSRSEANGASFRAYFYSNLPHAVRMSHLAFLESAGCASPSLIAAFRWAKAEYWHEQAFHDWTR
jgi:hypothetical protein